MRWTETPIVAFDTETTGLDPWLGDRMIEFAAVVLHVDDSGRLDEDAMERHHFLVNPGRPIPREASAVTGITDADVASAPEFAEKAQEIWDLMKGRVTVAHNYDFDQAVLASEFQRLGRFWPTPLAEIDTLDLSRRFFKGSSKHKLGDMASRLSIRLEGAHRAVNDAEACGRSFLAMTRRFDAPSDLNGMLEWADSIGRPPDAGPLVVDPTGRVVFSGGEFDGRPVAMHPDHLAWMVVARERVEQQWQYRFSESVRRWSARFLRLRAAGRAIQSGRHFGPDDWAPESCVLPDPAPGGAPGRQN